MSRGIEDLESLYIRRRSEWLEPIARNLRGYLNEILKNTNGVDRISVRSKSVESFCRKASMMSDGRARYDRPLSDVQDQLGARVVVRYLKDRESVGEVVSTHFGPIEEQEKRPESDSEFGYEGRHYLLLISDHLIPDSVPENFEPKVFELQIKTLFQHAWGEAGHDLAYKPTKKLTAEQRRMIAFTAAQAWGADKIFDNLANDLESA